MIAALFHSGLRSCHPPEPVNVIYRAVRLRFNSSRIVTNHVNAVIAELALLDVQAARLVYIRICTNSSCFHRLQRLLE